MKKGRVALVTALSSVLVLELYGVLGDSDTISGLTADLFNVESEGGRFAFGASWLAFSAWYLLHIWRFRQGKPNPKDNTPTEGV